MSRAFFKKVASKRRWRIVTFGKDADDLTLDPNFVVFDSEFSNTLSVYNSAIVPIGSAVEGQRIISWPALPYIPLTLVNATSSDSGSANLDCIIGSSSSGALAYLDVGVDGIYLYNPATWIFPFNIWYVAFRVPV